MIRHVVCLTPASPEAAQELPAIMAGLGALVGQIEGFTAFEYGANIDAEGRSPDTSHLFTCDFADRAALDRYAIDTRHRALGAKLQAACARGGIIVYDMEYSV